MRCCLRDCCVHVRPMSSCSAKEKERARGGYAIRLRTRQQLDCIGSDAAALHQAFQPQSWPGCPDSMSCTLVHRPCIMHGRGCSRARQTVSDLIQAGSADLLVLIGGQADTPQPAGRVSLTDASHGRLPAIRLMLPRFARAALLQASATPSGPRKCICGVSHA